MFSCLLRTITQTWLLVPFVGEGISARHRTFGEDAPCSMLIWSLLWKKHCLWRNKHERNWYSRLVLAPWEDPKSEAAAVARAIAAMHGEGMLETPQEHCCLAFFYSGGGAGDLYGFVQFFVQTLLLLGIHDLMRWDFQVSAGLQDYTFAIKTLGRKHLCQEAWAILQSMIHLGPPPNVIHFNAAISACEASGYWEGASTCKCLTIYNILYLYQINMWICWMYLRPQLLDKQIFLSLGCLFSPISILANRLEQVKRCFQYEGHKPLRHFYRPNL